jgi:hypothetical protein
MADRTAIEWTDASWTPIRARNLATGKVGWFCTQPSRAAVPSTPWSYPMTENAIPDPTAPDPTALDTPTAQHRLASLARYLAKLHGGSAVVILTNGTGIAVQACAVDAVDTANMAYGLLSFASEKFGDLIGATDCPACRDALTRLIAAREVLGDGPAGGHAPSHQVH